MSFEKPGRNKQLEWNAMSLSNDIANIINARTLTLLLLSEYVKDIGGLVPVRGARGKRKKKKKKKERGSEWVGLVCVVGGCGCEVGGRDD